MKDQAAISVCLSVSGLLVVSCFNCTSLFKTTSVGECLHLKGSYTHLSHVLKSVKMLAAFTIGGSL